MAYDVIEIENKIVTEILFNQLEIDLNENEMFIELVYSNDSNKLKEILTDELDSSEYDLIKINEYEYTIKFNIEIEYYKDSNEYLDELKSELEYYDELYSSIL